MNDRYTPAAMSALAHLEQARESADAARRALMAEAKAAQAMRDALFTFWRAERGAQNLMLADVLRNILKAGGYRIAGGHKDAKDGRADYYLERIIG
jgi:cysteinyl-tRNA synthetase